MCMCVCIHECLCTHAYVYIFIPNTAVFGPTNFIGTTTTTARMKIWMKILGEDF